MQPLSFKSLSYCIVKEQIKSLILSSFQVPYSYLGT